MRVGASAGRSPHGRGFKAAWLRPIPLVLGLCAYVHARSAIPTLAPDERDRAVASELSRRGLDAAASDVHWVQQRTSAALSLIAAGRAVVLAHRPGERTDVYLVIARLSPEGSVLEVPEVHNLTRTSAVSEDRLVAIEGHAAWAVGNGSRVLRIELADVGHEEIPEAETWTRAARVQHAVTNWQRTGSPGGVGRRSFRLDPAATSVSLVADAGSSVPRLRIVADDHAITVPFRRGAAIENERFVREEDRELASPGNLVTWAVDRARETSWFGDERMQLTKAIAYAALDRIERAASVVRTPAVEEAAADELGARPETAATAAGTDPEAGWPPPPAVPFISPPQPEEGQWMSLEKDPYVQKNPGGPTPLVTTYLRAEGSRPEARVVVVAWDTRQVELDVVPGTEEPQSATGETGTGMIPRDPRVVRRLVAAFNGGFQSTHGDFGMQADGVLLVPPKPFAATVARTRDGATVFGTWPRDLTVPAEFVSFRQNLTPLVEGGRFNPWNRTWWGGVPHDWEDETRTVRSGLCLARKGGFAAYLYGTKVDHARLGKAMLAVGCDYGLHLDMNQGHTGIELYRVYPDGSLPKLTGKLDGHWQAEGPVLGMPGYTFRGRKLTRGMQLMHFPRYIRRGARDYFYLTLKPTLPGRELSGRGASEPGEGAWAAAEAPPARFPQSIATTTLRPDAARPESKVHVVKFDPGTLRLASPAEAPAPSVVEFAQNAAPHAGAAGVPRLWLDEGRAAIGVTAPRAGATPLWAGEAAPREVRAGACVDDEGMVLYAEVATAADPLRDRALLDLTFDAAQCEARLYLTTPLALALAGERDLSGHPARLRSGGIRLVRSTAPHARHVFTDTKVLTPAEWVPLQRQTRYFPKPEQPEPAPSGTPPTTSAPDSEEP